MTEHTVSHSFPSPPPALAPPPQLPSTPPPWTPTSYPTLAQPGSQTLAHLRFVEMSAADVAPPKPAAAARAGVPWIEKYRPRKVSDVVHQTEVTSVFDKVLNESCPNLPHLLFYGPPGSGKTSVILAACAQLFGPKYKASRVLELNASDDRGIKVVRQKVKAFAQAAVHAKPERTHDGVTYPVPPYKIVILDEADALLPDAQAALRRIIEQYCTVTRFCLICNYVSRIIEPLVSRCAKFRFHSITKDTMSSRITHIAKHENLTLSPACLASLDQVSQGDLRLAVQYLQVC